MAPAMGDSTPASAARRGGDQRCRQARTDSPDRGHWGNLGTRPGLHEPQPISIVLATLPEDRGGCDDVTRHVPGQVAGGSGGIEGKAGGEGQSHVWIWYCTPRATLGGRHPWLTAARPLARCT